MDPKDTIASHLLAPKRTTLRPRSSILSNHWGLLVLVERRTLAFHGPGTLRGLSMSRAIQSTVLTTRARSRIKRRSWCQLSKRKTMESQRRLRTERLQSSSRRQSRNIQSFQAKQEIVLSKLPVIQARFLFLKVLYTCSRAVPWFPRIES